MEGAIGFGFASHWFKKWHEIFKPMAMRSNRKSVITLVTHLKTALLALYVLVSSLNELKE